MGQPNSLQKGKDKLNQKGRNLRRNKQYSSTLPSRDGKECNSRMGRHVLVAKETKEHSKTPKSSRSSVPIIMSCTATKSENECVINYKTVHKDMYTGFSVCF